MGLPAQRPVEVFRVSPAAFWAALFVALLLQVFLPLRMTFAQFFDFPLLVTIYFSLLRRNRVFGLGLGTALGILQDALSHGYLGTFGMAKALVGYLAAAASVKFDLEQLLGRLVVAGGLILAHNLFLRGLRLALLETVPTFQPLDLVVSLLANVSLALVLFLILDRFRRPA